MCLKQDRWKTNLLLTVPVISYEILGLGWIIYSDLGDQWPFRSFSLCSKGCPDSCPTSYLVHVEVSKKGTQHGLLKKRKKKKKGNQRGQLTGPPDWYFKPNWPFNSFTNKSRLLELCVSFFFEILGLGWFIYEDHDDHQLAVISIIFFSFKVMFRFFSIIS